MCIIKIKQIYKYYVFDYFICIFNDCFYSFSKQYNRDTKIVNNNKIQYI